MKKLMGVALLAGLCGGLAEIGWISLYSAATATSAGEVAREISATVLPTTANAPWAPWAGAGIHLGLSLALGVAFATALWGFTSGRPGRSRIWASAVLVLVGVWAFNFFLLLPALNSSFATLLPYGATLLSKTLFGVAMAAVLQNAAPRIYR